MLPFWDDERGEELEPARSLAAPMGLNSALASAAAAPTYTVLPRPLPGAEAGKRHLAVTRSPERVSRGPHQGCRYLVRCERQGNMVNIGLPTAAIPRAFRRLRRRCAAVLHADHQHSRPAARGGLKSALHLPVSGPAILTPIRPRIFTTAIDRSHHHPTGVGA